MTKNDKLKSLKLLLKHLDKKDCFMCNFLEFSSDGNFNRISDIPELMIQAPKEAKLIYDKYPNTWITWWNCNWDKNNTTRVWRINAVKRAIKLIESK